jgi:hypothetical protein
MRRPGAGRDPERNVSTQLRAIADAAMECAPTASGSRSRWSTARASSGAAAGDGVRRRTAELARRKAYTPDVPAPSLEWAKRSETDSSASAVWPR